MSVSIFKKKYIYIHIYVCVMYYVLYARIYHLRRDKRMKDKFNNTKYT